MHELVHNVWSDHDADFHALNRQLNRECDAYAAGQSVTGLRPTAFGSFTDGDGEAGDDVGYEGGTFVLGGADAGTGIGGGLPMREVMARAALSRLSKEEREMVEGCGHGSSREHSHNT